MRIWTPAIYSILAALFACVWLVTPAQAQEDQAKAWATLRFDEVNMRVGPSAEYPIDWVYRRKGLPVQIIRTREAWHLVRDHDGTQGWIAESQLRRTRSVLVIGEEPAVLHETPQAGGTVRWRAEPGVVGRLLECDAAWCEIDVEGRRGWVEAARLWGDEELETP